MLQKKSHLLSSPQIYFGSFSNSEEDLDEDGSSANACDAIFHLQNPLGSEHPTGLFIQWIEENDF